MRVKGFRLAGGGVLMLVLLAGTLAIGFAPNIATHAQDGEEGEGETTPEGTPTPDTGYIFGYRQEIL
ncbi:MAG: hypothetical protein HY866_15925, partial [Chloroflexi bacterium]|nr:hypothetical protein [Chloroflexota bacterium]